MSHLLKLSAAEMKDRATLRLTLEKLFGAANVQENREVRGYGGQKYHKNADLVVLRNAYHGFGDLGFKQDHAGAPFSIFMDDMDFDRVKSLVMPTVGSKGPTDVAQLLSMYYTATGVEQAMSYQGYQVSQELDAATGEILVKAYAF